MEYDQTQNKINIPVIKDGLYEKNIIMSCNMAYPDEDDLCFNFNFTEWMHGNISWWTYKQTYKHIIFVFDNIEDATLFKLTYL